MAQLPKDMRVAVVDAFSSGKYLSAALLKQGWQCVHVQSDPDVPGFLLEGFPKGEFEACILHEGDLDQTAKVLSSLSVGRVIVGCETGVELADALQDVMGFPGNGAQNSLAHRDKYLMQKALRDRGVEAMAFHKTSNFEDLTHWIRDRGKWPVVLKPLKGAGTQGVHVCRNLAETGRAFAEIMGGPDIFDKPNTAVLAEEFLLGVEYVVNTVSVNGRHVVSDVWEYRKEEIPGAAPVYDFVRLLAYPDRGLEGLLDYAFSVLDALGIRLGPAHTEIKMTQDGPRLIETGARIMGGCIPPDLISECIGRNQVDLTIDAYAHPEHLFESTRKPYRLKKHLMLKWMISLRERSIRSIPAMDIIGRLPSHYDTCFSVAPGGIVPRTIDMVTSPAHILLRHSDEATLLEDYHVLHNLEMEAADCLFDPLLPGDHQNQPPLGQDWVENVPDETWNSPMEKASSDASTITGCLGLAAGQRVLDCPCGDGRIAVHLARSGISITGVDINERFIRQAGDRFREAGLDGEFIKMDMRFLPFKDEFDAVVVWFNSFGYFGGVDDIACMESLGRALKPGGRLLVEAPNRRKVLSQLRKSTTKNGVAYQWNEGTKIVDGAMWAVQDGKEIRTPFHFRMYSEGEYRVLMRCAGLMVEKVFGEGKTPFGLDSQRMIIIGRKG